MKRYFLNFLGLAFVVCQMSAQNAILLNDNSDQDLSLVSTVAGKNTDEKLLMEARSAHNSNVSANTIVDEPIEADALFVYPNPTKGVVELKLTGKILVYVYTLSGQFLRKVAMPPGEKILDLSSLGAGVYHIMAKSDEDYFSGKLIIQ